MIEARFSVSNTGKLRQPQAVATSVFASDEARLKSPAALQANTALTRASFSLMAALLDMAAVLSASMFADVSYNALAHQRVEICPANLQLGVFAAILFVALNVTRHSYAVADYLDMSGHAQRTFSQWNIAFLAAATFGFLARAIEDSSRGAFIVFYVAGLFSLYAGRAALVRIMQRSARRGGVLASRVLIVGFERDVADFTRIYQPGRQGMGVVATPILHDSPDMLAADLEAATETARRLMPDDIIVVIPWAKAEVIDQCVTALMRVPASLYLHLEPNCALNRFAGAQMGSRGAISSFRLRGYSMSITGVAMKRLMDIGLALAALIILAPLFLIVAIAIKLESRGPALFLQTRQGFNKNLFRIVKFRSMTTMEDGGAVRQATANDARITRVGRLIRKFNIDELPQLLNVLRGEMSLVGPRPHALVHDEQFEPEIALYARRHNVKPGITGWAQVNGLRGETDTAEKIARRVHYDLYYIDNWSLALDIWILFLTLFSRKAYQNAG